MNIMTSAGFLYVGLGGGLGAMLRYGVSLLFSQTSTLTKFPWSTLTVNLIGCFVIGLLWQYSSKSPQISLFWVVGVLGGFTTFSSFGLDGLKLFQQEAYSMLAGYVLLSNIVGLLLVFLGVKSGTLIQAYL